MHCLASRSSVLRRTCVASLDRFFLEKEGLFARSISWDGRSWKKTGPPSLLNTANVLMALYELSRHGHSHSIDAYSVMERLVTGYFQDLSRYDYSDAAFALWADAIGGRRHLSKLWEVLQGSLPRRVSDTMKLAWTLSALCHYFPVAEEPDPVSALARQLYKRIAANQSAATGLFHQSGDREGWLGRRRPIASLSSQTYPIQAFALFGRAFGSAEALEKAQRCADTICRMQGPQGQWWWRYDVAKGSVAEKYPVYAVNQDGAIPMALGELQRALQDRRYEEAIARGIEWLFGDNELSTSLVDEEAGVIWRAIQQDDHGEFGIVHEMYSYHPARCLYGLCGERGA